MSQRARGRMMLIDDGNFTEPMINTSKREVIAVELRSLRVMLRVDYADAVAVVAVVCCTMAGRVC